jgi:transcriptional regulator with XRE-family HTH domain
MRKNLISKKSLMKIFPGVLAESRSALGLSQTALALQAGISQCMISQMEAGVKLPTLTTFLRLHTVLNFSPTRLLLQASREEARERLGDQNNS